MADRQLVISEPLCFLVNKLTTLPLFTLKSVLEDFYDGDAISEAKSRLLDDIATTFSDNEVIPHVPRRRSGVNKHAAEIDDILTILTTLDEKKLLNVLPRYVISSPDKIPSLRLFDGDMRLILDKMHKFDSGMENFNSRLSAIMNEVTAIRQCTDKVQTTIDMTESCSTVREPGMSVKNVGQSHHLQHQPVFVPAPGPSNSQVSMSFRNSTSTPNNDVFTVSNGLSGNSNNWAQSVAAQMSQRTADTDTDTDTGFTVVRGRKRQRGSPKAVHQQPGAAPASVRPGQQSSQQRRRRNVIGKQMNSDDNLPIKAATQIFKKSVFCIDNVDLSVTVDALTDYIKTKNISVVSVFQVKPRRRRNETTVTDRRAFRVCIDYSDQDKLLDESTWPSSVIISDWYHKPRPQTDNNTQQHDVPTINTDMDATVIVNTPVAPTTAADV